MYDDLIKQLRYCADATTCRHCPWRSECCLHDAQRKAADAIEELSKERKTGEWCADYDGYSDGEPVYDMWWCSACGEYFDEWDDRPTWKYCPNCGAKMSEGDEDEEPPKEE